MFVLGASTSGSPRPRLWFLDYDRGLLSAHARSSHVVGKRKLELYVRSLQAGGEFGMGTAQQYGEADVKGKDFSGQVTHAHPAISPSL